MSTAEPSHASPCRRAVSLAAMDGPAVNVDVVERFLAAFDRRWPTDDELDELLAPDVRFVERPNLVNPKGGERDAAAMRAGIEAGRKLLAWQRYEVRDHVASGDTSSRACAGAASSRSTPARGRQGRR